MPDPRVTIVIGAKDEATPVVKQAEESVSGLGTSADKVTASAERTTKSLGGMRAGVIGLSSGMFLGGEAFNTFNNQVTKGAAALETARAAFHLFALALIDPTPMGFAAAGIGLVIGALNAYNEQQKEAQKKSKDLEDSLKKLMEAETPLAKVIQAATGVTKDQADMLARAATASDAVQDGLRKQVALNQLATSAGKEYADVLRATVTQIIAQGNATQAEAEAQAQLDPMVIAAKQHLIDASRGAQDYERSLNASASAADDFKNRIDFLQKNLPAAATEISRYSGSVKELAATHKAAMDKIKADWDNAFKDAEENATKAWDKAAKDIDKIERNLDENIQKERDALAKSLDAIDKERIRQIDSISKEETKIAQDTSKKLEQIERDRIEALAKLDTETGRSLRKATTEHEREDILELRAEKIAEIEQTASDKRRAAQEERTQRIADNAERRKELQDEFAERRAQAEADTAARIEEMRRQAEQQKADRRQSRDDEIATINEALGKQLAAINQRKIDEEVAYKSRREKEFAAHSARMNELLVYKTEAVKGAEAEKAIRDTVWNKYLEDLDRAKTGLANLTIPSPTPPRYQFSPNFYGAAGYQTGADFMVPSGFPNDSYPLRVSSGEHVQVTPAGQSPSKSVGTMNFYIQSNDPAGVRDEIRRYLENEAWVG